MWIDALCIASKILDVPSSALPRPPQGRTSWPSGCGEVLSARSCQISSSCVRPWLFLAWPTWWLQGKEMGALSGDVRSRDVDGGV